MIMIKIYQEHHYYKKEYVSTLPSTPLIKFYGFQKNCIQETVS
jgi:hypothetical protein